MTASSASSAYEQAEIDHGPAIREQYAGWEDDGKHVFVVTWRRSDGTTDLIVWRTFAAFVACVARHRAFRACEQALETHYVLIH